MVHVVSSMQDIGSHYDIVTLIFVESLRPQILLNVQRLVRDEAPPGFKFSLSLFKKASRDVGEDVG